MLIRKLSFNRTLVFVCALLTFATATAFMMRDGSAHFSTSRSAALNGLAQKGTDTSPAPVIRIWVHPDDIYPDVIKVKAGRAILLVENQKTTNASLVVEKVLADQNKQSVAAIAASNIAKRAGNVVDLGPGEYIFYEQSRPDLTGTIIVEEQ